MGRRLVIQLARLGDVIQSAPVVSALAARNPDDPLDLLCAAPLAPVAACLPGLSRVLPWDGQDWRRWADHAALAAAEATLQALAPAPYEIAYNLNQHARAALAGHLLARRLVGPGEGGPLSPDLPPWAEHLRRVAYARGGNRVHLADAWCGLCGVRPPGWAPVLALPDNPWPRDLDDFRRTDGLRVALVVGAGDRERAVPLRRWVEWITLFLSSCAEGRVALVGGRGERETALAIQDALPAGLSGRVWDAVGRTTLVELAALLASCRWVLGGDTGPLHLAAAVGARVMGFYLARARVHETGPYGKGHWVWQQESHEPRKPAERTPATAESEAAPARWPVRESVEMLMAGSPDSVPEGVPEGAPEGWTLWRSAMDQWGVFYFELGAPAVPDPQRERLWRALAGFDAEPVVTPYERIA